jgi:hypothetical protein
MAFPERTFEDVLPCAKQRTPGQKLHLIAALARDLVESLRHAAGGQQPLQSLDSLWQDFGMDKSAKEIEEPAARCGEAFLGITSG